MAVSLQEFYQIERWLDNLELRQLEEDREIFDMGGYHDEWFDDDE